ncbi:MAG TPA: endoribonuclease MazF [Bryobacteraceae bacterium]|nr:endoribonuclease MazF [Bryobacteraceae bacterium]
MAAFVPERGDLIWLTFDPQAGHEQAGRRPALVLSPRAYNQKSGLALVCPITSQVKGYPFEVLVEEACGVAGVVLADQVRSLDGKARRAERIGGLSTAAWEEVLARIAPLLGF